VNIFFLGKIYFIGKGLLFLVIVVLGLALNSFDVQWDRTQAMRSWEFELIASMASF